MCVCVVFVCVFYVMCMSECVHKREISRQRDTETESEQEKVDAVVYG